jgi:hypothetical protein
MSLFSLKPTHSPVKNYYAALAQFHLYGHDTEGNTRSAFADLIKKCCSPYGWHLVEEYQFKGTAKQSLRADGALVDDLIHSQVNSDDLAGDFAAARLFWKLWVDPFDHSRKAIVRRPGMIPLPLRIYLGHGGSACLRLSKPRIAVSSRGLRRALPGRVEDDRTVPVASLDSDLRRSHLIECCARAIGRDRYNPS